MGKLELEERNSRQQAKHARLFSDLNPLSLIALDSPQREP